MIVSVQFQSKKTGEFTGNTYNYLTSLSLEPGSIVKVPTANGDGIAKVVKVNVPDCDVPQNILPLLKTISELAEVEDDK